MQEEVEDPEPEATVELATLFTAERIRPYRSIAILGSGAEHEVIETAAMRRVMGMGR